MEIEGRGSYRRSGRDRRRRQVPVSGDRRKGGNRRARANRRARESVQGALARAGARTDARTDGGAAAAPKPQVAKPGPKAAKPGPREAKPGPREPGRIALNDIVLRSLAGVDPASFASRLVNLKVFPSVGAARRALDKTPAVLARYVGHETSYRVWSSLKQTGADVDLRNSRVNCLHCAISVPCEGEAKESLSGIVFSCPFCHGLTMLDVRDRSFHPLLRCGACHSLLTLPAKAQAGKYLCKCGEALRYETLRDAAFQSSPQKVAKQRTSRVTPLVAILSVAVFFLAAMWTSLLPVPGLASRREAARPAPEPQRTTAYLQFNASTDRAMVVAALGPPERETATEDGTHQVLFYRRYDFYVVLERRATSYTYAMTVRISDGVVLHKQAAS